MTERKPPWTTQESWVEAQIRIAMEGGAFDNLPGAGKPIPDLDQARDPDWWVKQLMKREQLSFLPPSMELARKVEKELAEIETLDSEPELRRRAGLLNAEIAKTNKATLEGPPTSLAPLDVEKLVERWRIARSRSA
ncbi:MAG: DUF1992 domain-containing protein [Hyphomicrobiales bacterium]|nr:MAG: DUF1992 domain-containing protein [Hyphomicrobiales bacterium]